MILFFNTLTYSGHPLLFEGSKATNMAQCIYKLAGSKTVVESQLINNKLEKIEGIKILNGVATIVDLSEFKKIHPYSFPMESGNLSRASLAASATFFQSSSSGSVPSKLKKSPHCANLALKRFPFEALLEECSGETLVYETDLRENNRLNLPKLARLSAHSVTSVNLTLQVIKNIDYYFLRQSQMKLIRQLYEEIIAPSLAITLHREIPPKFIADYFRQGITSIMRNKKYNFYATAFEQAQIEDNSPIPVEDNYKIRAIYAHNMLSAFFYFIENIPAPVKPANDELTKWLHDFKTQLQSHKEKMTLILNELLQLTICSGLIDYEHEKLKIDLVNQGGYLDFSVLLLKIKTLQIDNTTLKYALDNLNPIYSIPPDLKQEDLPPKLFSLRGIIHNWFHKCLPEKVKAEIRSEELGMYVGSMMKELIDHMLHYTEGNRHSPQAKWVSHTIKNSDSDLYLTQQMKIALEKQLQESEPALTGVKKGNKYLVKLQMEMIKLVKNNLDHYMHDLMQENRPLASPELSSYSLN